MKKTLEQVDKDQWKDGQKNDITLCRPTSYLDLDIIQPVHTQVPEKKHGPMDIQIHYYMYIETLQVPSNNGVSSPQSLYFYMFSVGWYSDCLAMIGICVKPLDTPIISVYYKWTSQSVVPHVFKCDPYLPLPTEVYIPNQIIQYFLRVMFSLPIRNYVDLHYMSLVPSFDTQMAMDLN